MAERTEKASTRLEPETSWTIVTEAPLKGFGLAREAGRIVAWDEGNQLYLFSVQGESLSFSRVPQRIAAGAISDDGSLIAFLGDGDDASLLLLSPDFQVEVDRPAPSESSFVTVDPHGRFVAVGNRLGAVTFFNKYGKVAGRLETIQPLAHLCFLADRPFLVGAAAFGMLVGVDIEASRSAGRLEPELAWQDRLMSNVGRLAVSGDGGMILASCFTHGIQRFDLRGRNEGSYHLGGTVSHAVPDFPGRTIVAATLEGELAIMNSAGNVRWRTQFPRPPIALEVDPLGRYVIYGHSTGEVIRLELFGGGSGRATGGMTGAASPAETRTAGPRTSTGSVRRPDWTAPALKSEQQAEAAVLAVAEDPACIALFTSPHRLQLYGLFGEKLGEGPDMAGVGRILRISPGWLAAATDRQIVLCDLRRKTSRRLDLSLVELTHLAIKPDTYGLAIVQERDRIGRVTPSSRWVWKRELKSPVEDLVIGPEGFVAVTDNDGRLMVFDPTGEPTIGATFDPSDPPLLVDAPDGAAPGVVWVALCRRTQQLTAHELRGKRVWTCQLPWEGWSLVRLGRFVVASAADGRAMAIDGSGAPRQEGVGGGGPSDIFTLDEQGQPVRVSRHGVHLICAGMDGRVRWRAVGDETLGPFAAGPSGVAIVLGQSLAWFTSVDALHQEPARPRQ
jgi:hypothetical protein